MRAALVASLCLLASACSLVSNRGGPGTTAPVEEPLPPAGAAVPPGAPPLTQEPPSAEDAPGAALAAAASALIGTPYHFGGADEGGFDCSGLALYVHERVGLAIPRTAAEQQRAARAVPLAQILPGDLLFFHIRRHGIDHVGIYLGGGRFVHAPHAGIAVAEGDLTSAYFARHLVSAGRFWTPVPPPP
jgi:cell wall-associated NlpC family hydrolase